MKYQPLLIHGFININLQRELCTKSDEVRLAQEASKKYGTPAPTIFSKVIDKTIPADIIYEDDKVDILIRLFGTGLSVKEQV